MVKILTDDEAFTQAHELGLNLIESRTELISLKANGQSSTLFYYCMRKTYLIKKLFLKEVKFYEQSSRDLCYQQRVSLVGSLYICLVEFIKKELPHFLAKEDVNSVSNDENYRNFPDQLNKKLRVAGAIYGLIIQLFHSQKELDRKNYSAAYTELSEKLIGLIKLEIKAAFKLLNHDFRKSKTDFKKMLTTLFDIQINQYKALQSDMEFYQTNAEYRDKAAELDERKKTLQANQRRGAQARTKYTEDVKSSWIVESKKLLEANPALSINSLATILAAKDYGHVESIRKFLSKNIGNSI